MTQIMFRTSLKHEIDVYNVFYNLIRSQMSNQLKEIVNKSIKIDLELNRYRPALFKAVLPPPTIADGRQWHQSTPGSLTITTMPLAGAAVA